MIGFYIWKEIKEGHYDNRQARQAQNTCKFYRKYNYEFGGEEAVFWEI